MKKLVAACILAVALATGTVARAEEVLGTVTKIDISGPGAKVATATLLDASSSKAVDLTILDALTLDKFKDHRINVGDEIKARYEKKGGKNVSKFFKKPGGC